MDLYKLPVYETTCPRKKQLTTHIIRCIIKENSLKAERPKIIKFYIKNGVCSFLSFFVGYENAERVKVSQLLFLLSLRRETMRFG